MGCRPSKSGNAAFLRPCTLETGSDYVYVSGLGDVLSVLIPAFVIYTVIYGICFLLMKQNEKQINQALKEK